MNRLVNLRQLALALRLPRAWLEAEALAARIPCLRIGSRLRFSLEAVEQSLAERAGKASDAASRHAPKSGHR